MHFLSPSLVSVMITGVTTIYVSGQVRVEETKESSSTRSIKEPKVLW